MSDWIEIPYDWKPALERAAGQVNGATFAMRDAGFDYLEVKIDCEPKFAFQLGMAFADSLRDLENQDLGVSVDSPLEGDFENSEFPRGRFEYAENTILGRTPYTIVGKLIGLQGFAPVKGVVPEMRDKSGKVVTVSQPGGADSVGGDFHTDPHAQTAKASQAKGGER